MAARILRKWSMIFAARAAKQIDGKGFVKNFKFCYDEDDGIVYCHIHLDDLADHSRFTYNVGEETITFFK
jgi:hypothetical protein